MPRQPSYTRRPLHTLSKEHQQRLKESDEARAKNPLRRGGAKSETVAPVTSPEEKTEE